MTLDPRHQAQLDASGISADVAEKRPYISLTAGAVKDWRELAGDIHGEKRLRTILKNGALAFPLYRCGQPEPFTWILRPDTPRTDKKSGKVVKYEYPFGVGNVLDVLPEYQNALTDQNTPIWITEGAKKADALATAYGSAIVPVNENGVFGWRSNGRVVDDLAHIAWEGRRIIIAPDADARSNRQVRTATNRLAKLLTAKGAGEVLLLMLPTNPDMPTMGVDDYLGQGHTIGELESLLVTQQELNSTAKMVLMRHPDTGAPLSLPKGYEVQAGTITRYTPQDLAIEVYDGRLAVIETGHDLDTDLETMTVLLNSRGRDQRVTAPRSTFAQARHCTPLLSDYGAAIYDQNAKEVTRYLARFASENEEALPHRANSQRWGLVGGGLVLPGGSIGFAEEVSYCGATPITVGSDHDAYPEALRQIIETWDETITSLVIALALAGPVIARMKPRRNPVVYVHGGSNSGKSTLLQFAAGMWGNPTERPIRLEGSSSTRISILQTLTTLSGLPLFIDEVHTTQNPHDVEHAVYSFANAQARSTGSINGTPNGGGALHGTLFLGGEASTDFRYAGASNRVLLLSADLHPPLGNEAPARSEEGQRRATLLEEAWQSGAGTFGPRVVDVIWNDWAAFTRRVRELRDHPAIVNIPAWRDTLAMAAATLEVAAVQCGAAWDSTPAALDTWADLLRLGRVEHDPATDAFEQVRMLVGQGEQRAMNQTNTVVDMYRATPDGGWEVVPWAVWEIRMIGGQQVAYRKITSDEWRIPTNTHQFRQRVGEQAAQLHGRLWLHKQWVREKAGRTTRVEHLPGMGPTRCIVVPDAVIQGDDDEAG